MSNRKNEPSVTPKKLSAAARTSVKQHSNLALDYIMTRSTVLAVASNSDEIQSTHVRQAFTDMITSGKSHQTWRQIVSILGTVALGAAGQSLFTEYFSTTPNMNLVAASWMVSLISLGLCLFALVKK